MTTTLFTILMILCLLYLWRAAQQRLALEQYTYRMYALRDQLRSLAINGDIPPDDEDFKRLDFVISLAIKEAYYYTLFYIMAVRIKAEPELRKINAQEEEMPMSPALEAILADFSNITADYIKAQHQVTMHVIVPIARMVIGAASVSRKFREVVETIHLDAERRRRYSLQAV